LYWCNGFHQNCRKTMMKGMTRSGVFPTLRKFARVHWCVNASFQGKYCWVHGCWSILMDKWCDFVVIEWHMFETALFGALEDSFVEAAPPSPTSPNSDALQIDRGDNVLRLVSSGTAIATNCNIYVRLQSETRVCSSPTSECKRGRFGLDIFRFASLQSWMIVSSSVVLWKKGPCSCSR
jgi:hypothetical protein